MVNESTWPFDQGPDVAAVTSTHIMNDGCPVLLVTHYDDDHSWGFQSGKPVTMADALVVRMDTMLRTDPTLAEVADLPPGWTAERNAVGSEWRRSRSEFEDDE
jgi:hypothetical protein